MTLNNSMSITPSSPGQAKGERFEHGSVLGGKTRSARVSSQWKSTANISDGKFVAIGNNNAEQLIGTDMRTLKDSTGKSFGAEQYAGFQKPEGEITETSYMFPRPGADKTPVPKVSLVTRVRDIGCGVGYYK